MSKAERMLYVHTCMCIYIYIYVYVYMCRYSFVPLTAGSYGPGLCSDRLWGGSGRGSWEYLGFYIYVELMVPNEFTAVAVLPECIQMWHVFIGVSLSDA